MEPQLNQGDDEDKVSGSNSKQSYNFQASDVNPKREKYLRYRTRLNAAEVDYAVTINLQLGSGSMVDWAEISIASSGCNFSFRIVGGLR